MRTLQASKGLTVTASVLALTLALGTPAYAQTANEPDPPETLEGEVETESGQNADTDGDDQIVVTGSRIRRPNLDSTVPITSVGIQELTDTGDVNIGDALNDLPSLRSTFSQGNSTRFIGTAGLNVLDLRGLGVSRTLVLVNSRRHVTSLPGENWVDVNTIPTDLIERVDVVTGGNSAIYGSDAVAGVVNFVLKRDFEGIRLRGQGGISERGDRGSYFTSLTAGRNFAEGRGNVAIAAEYAKSNPLYFRDRDELTGAYSGRCQFQAVDSNAGEPRGGDGIFDNEFLCGVRNGSIDNGGTLGGFGDGRFLRFDPNGNVYIDVPTRAFPGVSGNVIGGNGATLRDTGQLAAGLQRYSANLLARYEISPALRPFIEAKYVHIDSVQEGQPSFFQGSLANFFGGGPELRCSNPFLTAQALGQLQTYGICDPADPEGEFAISRFNVDFGGRGEQHDRDVYRVVAGIEGDFNDDWRYELAGNYGRFESRQRSLNNLYLFDENFNPDGFLNAIDATRDASGNIVCRVNVDADPTNDDSACVPINVFGFGAPSQAALDYVNRDSIREEWAEQIVASAFVAGDMSQLFELPGGPIGFALGAEYRTEDSYAAYDEVTAAGRTFLNAIPPFEPPALEVKDVFGELRIPLLRDLPFANELTIEVAGRLSDYNNSVGTVFAYNLGGTWAPSSDIRFRGNYSKSVRAPTQGDLFATAGENFAFIADPCSVENIGNNANRAANCAAGGVPLVATPALEAVCASSPFPTPAGSPFNNCLARAFSTGFLSGGNPTLTEETGKSYTIGAAFTPTMLPGFSLTVDYYNIKVEKLIATLSAQSIINNCYDNPSGIDNPFCATVQRDPTTGFFVEPAVIAGPVNFASQETEGIDFDVAYRKTFDNGHRLNLRAIATRLLKLNNFTDPQFPDAPNRQRGELGDPDWALNFSLNYDFGGLDVGYTMRYIGPQTIGAYEAQNSYQGVCTAAFVTSLGCTLNDIVTLPPQNADQFPRINYPDVMYHNIRLGYEVAEDFAFYAGVDNVLDRQPPLGSLGTAGGDPFDSIGRFFYAGARVDF